MPDIPVKKSKLVIFGIEDFAEIAYEYFTWDSGYEVVAFTVDRAYMHRDSLFGLPVIAFEDLRNRFPPAHHEFYAAIVYTDLNRLRETICRRAKSDGYRLAGYISSRASISRTATLGEHCFIFENNSIQPYARLGDDAVLWCNNQVSHHSSIGSHCFLSGSVAIGGWTTIDNYCFFGLNSTLANNTRIGEGSWISHGACLSGIIPPASFVPAGANSFLPLDESRLFLSLSEASRKRKLYGVTESNQC